MVLRAGHRLSRRYELVRPLGSGAMGEGWVAHDRLLDRDVALKLLHADAAVHGEALLREFRILTRIDDERLLRVHDFGRARTPSGERAYYTSSLVQGVPLDAHANGRSFDEIAVAVADLVGGLGRLHRAGIRHGDVKPEHVLVDARGRATLIDFGCARAIGDDLGGEVWGTKGYIAPEILRGEPTDHRADLYALGVTLGAALDAVLGPVPERVARMVEALRAAAPSRRPADADEVLRVLGHTPALVRATGEPPRLFGRARELRTLEATLETLLAEAPGPRVLQVHGARGTGRTRLLDELKWIAEERATVVAAAHGLPRAFERMLEVACDGIDARGVELVVEARAKLAARGEPTVLVIDDVDAFVDEERELFEAWLRSADTRDPFLTLCASVAPPSRTDESVRALPLAALSPRDVAAWLDGLVTKPRIPEALARTEGAPRALRALAAALADGTLTEDRLDELDAGAIEGARISGLSSDALRVLALVAMAEEGPESALVAELADRDAVSSLVDLGLVEREGARHRLGSGVGEGLVLGRVDDAQRRALHRSLAAALAPLAPMPPLRVDLDTAVHAARHALHVALSGEVGAAATLLERAGDLFVRHPRPFVRVAELTSSAGPRAALVSARVLELAGRTTEALAVLEGVARDRRAQGVRAEAYASIAACALRQGDHARALAHVAKARTLARPTVSSARLADLESRALLKRGAHARAREVAEAALEDATDERERAALHDDAGAASSYLGDFTRADEHLGRARELHARAKDVRAELRSLSYAGFVRHRAGELRGAVEAFRAALELAEKEGLGDPIADAALNLGTASHVLGDWGAARAGYERALRMAVALGKVDSAVTVRFDLAKLDADVGSFDAARAEAEDALSLARRAEMRFFEGACASVLGEIAMARGDVRGAEERFLSARACFSTEGARREIAEVELLRGELCLATSRVDDAEHALESAEAALEDVDARDVVAAKEVLVGRIALVRGDRRAALAALESALVRGEASGDVRIEAEAARALAAAHRAQGSEVSARTNEERALAIWERVAATLPDAHRDAFWAHPRREGLRGRASPRATGRDTSRVDKLERLLAINRKLSASLDVARVLETTMDAAIELTRAERGFLLTVEDAAREPPTMRVAVARNVDRERLGRSHLKFSRSIAEEVVKSGEPIVTSDAEADGRFSSQASVHAMRLKSVVSVPIVGPRGVVGALYLDNRFQRGRFEDEDVTLLLAFADQAAIALENARLHEELARRSQELEVERRRVERLVAGQAEQIERLEEEVRTRQQALEHRYDYARIVGSSPAMQHVFALLDRVTESNAPVLALGESGTGKELIARALHFNGPRKARPFVAINCGALPSTLIESELFGHVRGAFTGAERDRTGVFVEADGGTLFLDEIGEMPLELQVRLLRVLQEREVRPVGGSHAIPVDVRLVAATNRDLRGEVAAGRFREDLFYRLSVVEIRVPPLRERAEDIPLIARHAAERAARELGRAEAPRLTQNAVRALLRHAWPGNVRELENVITKAILVSGGDVIDARDIDLGSAAASQRAPARTRAAHAREEADRIAATLRATGWNVCEVSRTLGIPRATLYRKMKRYGLAARG